MITSEASMISSSAVIASARVLARARERHAEVVGFQFRGRSDVFHVLGGECRRGQATALAVDALVVREHATLVDDGVDLRPLDRGHGEHDQAVVEQQRVARPHVLRQAFVIEADALVVAQLAAGVQDELRTRLEHCLAMLELADADLRPLQVHQYADRASGRARQ